MHRLLRLFAVALGVAALAAPAEALVIKQIEPHSSLASSVININDLGGRIEVDLTKDFTDPSMVGSPLILEFTLEASDAGKDIWLVHGADGEEVANNTGVDWTDFHFVLANVPAGLPAFLPQNAAAEFVDLGGVSSDVFGAPASAAADQIDFEGGPVASGGVVHFSGIHISHNDAVNGIFYLKEIPTPEPAALSLLLVGGALVVWRRTKKTD